MNASPGSDDPRDPNSRDPKSPRTPQRRGFGDPETRRRQTSASLLLSGLLIGISFLAMVIPLAAYHAAQVAATLGPRTSLLLQLAVAGAAFALGLFFGSPFLLVIAIVILFWTPLIAFACATRARRSPWPRALLALCVPVALTIGAAFAIPRVPDIDVAFQAQRQELLDSTRRPGVSPDDAKRALAWYDDSVKTLKENPDVLAEVAGYLGYSPWQRVGWLIYGTGAMFLIGLVLIVFGTLVFIDTGFEQVERLRAVVAYIRSLKNAFQNDFVAGLEASLPLVQASKGRGGPGAESLGAAAADEPGSPESAAFVVVRHRRLPEPGSVADPGGASSEGEGASWKRWVLAPGPNRVRIWGTEFQLARRKGTWNLRAFRLPLPLALGGALVLALPLFLPEGGEGQGRLYAILNLPIWGAVAGAAFLFALLVTCAVAMQGMVILYTRLTFPVVAVGVLVLLSLAPFLQLNPHLVLALFGSVGLLDYLYDFRRLENEVPAP